MTDQVRQIYHFHPSSMKRVIFLVTVVQWWHAADIHNYFNSSFIKVSFNLYNMFACVHIDIIYPLSGKSVYVKTMTEAASQGQHFQAQG